MDGTLRSGVNLPQSSYQKQMASLLEAPLDSDVLITVRDADPEEPETAFPAHKALLAARSSYFAAMFDSAKSLRESQSRAVTIEGVSPHAFRAYLHYLYTGQTERALQPSTAQATLELAARFLQQALFRQTQLYLVEHVDEGNVCALLRIADALHAGWLKEECLDLLTRLYATLRRHEEYLSLPAALRQEVAQFFTVA